ncbi:hypothetical protein ACLB2K_059399 [Fragaria x ananassa]
MEDNDPWLARDKLYHFLFCFSLTLLFSTFSARTPYPFLRRHSIRVGSLLSLLAGAAKEFADELGFFHSAGASAKDAVANFLGVVVASLLLSLARYLARSDNEAGRIKELSMRLLVLVACLLVHTFIGLLYLCSFVVKICLTKVLSSHLLKLLVKGFSPSSSGSLTAV